MFGIKIGNTWMDVPPDGKITFELNFSGFDEEIIPGSFSFPVDFPATPVNDLLFRHARLIDTYSKVKILEGELHILGSFFDRCKIIRLENSYDYYRCSVSLYGISVDIKGKNLSDIDTSALNRQFNKVVDLLNWMADCNQLGNEAFTWPVIYNPAALADNLQTSWVERHYNNIINRWIDNNILVPHTADPIADINFPRIFASPFIRVNSILEALFAASGLRCTGSFFEDPEINNLTIFSNKLLRADITCIVQASIVDFDITVYSYFYPLAISIGPDIMDQDYEQRLGVWVDSPILSYPAGTQKIKVESSDDVYISVRLRGYAPSGTFPFSMGVVIVNTTTGVVVDLLTDAFSSSDESSDYIFFRAITKADFIAYGETTQVAIFPVISTPNNIYIEKLSILASQNAVVLSPTHDQIEPLNVAEFLPKISISDFLLGLKKVFCINYGFDHVTKTVSIDFNKQMLRSPVEVVDHRIGSKLPAKTLDNSNGYKFSWDWTAADDDYTKENFKDFDKNDFIGYSDVNNPAPTEEGKFIINLMLNQVLKSVRIGGELTWQYYCDAFYDSVIGTGEKEVKASGFSPVLMQTTNLEGVVLTPRISTLMHYPRFKQINDTYSAVRLAFFRGNQNKKDSLVKVPMASSMRHRHIGYEGDSTILGQYTINWDAVIEQDLYNNFWRSWISFLMNTERIRDAIKVDLPFIQRIFKTQKQLKNTIFLAGKLTFTISSTGIDEAEIEIYRNNFNFDGTTE